MEYSEIIYLLNTQLQEDEIGNITPSFTSKTKCYAKKQSVKMGEYYNAVEVGLKPSCEFVVKRLNYQGQDEVEWNDKVYLVIRTIDPKNKFDIVLVCSEKTGVN